MIDIDLQNKLMTHMSKIKPRPSIYVPDFIAANQSVRADNIIKTNKKSELVDQIRTDIKDFKKCKGLDQVIVLWTANTERFSDEIEGLNDTSDNLLNSICKNESEISPSTLFAVASILEGVRFHDISSKKSYFFFYFIMFLVYIYQWITIKHFCKRCCRIGREIPCTYCWG